MATEADVLRSVTAILQSGERREQSRLDTALTMMAFQQQQRAADVDILTNKLQVASAANTEMQSGIVSDLLATTGLGSYYKQTEDPDDRHTYQLNAIDDLVDEIGLAPEVAKGAVQGLWSWYEAQNPRELISLASNLGKSVQSLEEQARIDPNKIDPNSGEARLIRSFLNLQKESKGIGDIRTIALQAVKNLENESNIRKESFEMVKGDYEIQSDIGVYEDIKEPMEQFAQPHQQFWTSQQGIDLMEQAVDASKSDEPWDMGQGTTLAMIGGIYGISALEPAVQSELAKLAEGADAYRQQLVKDLRHPSKGGIKWDKWKEKYPGTSKGQVKFKDKKALSSIDKMAKQAGRLNMSSVKAVTGALESLGKSRLLSAAGAGSRATGRFATGAGAYFAPMALSELGEYVGGELGGAVGQTAGTGLLANKILKRGKQSFASFMAKRAAATGVKMGALAMADSPFLPVGDFLALGLGALEVYHAYKDWQAYLEE